MSDLYDFESLQSNTKEIEDALLKDFAPKPKWVQDERFWKPKTNVSGNIYAEIRFMPPFKKDGFAHITKYFHAWQNTGNKRNFYVECPKTYGKECPICEEVTKLWQNPTDANQADRSKMYKKTNYTSVVYIVKDPEEPSNEGKFFFYTYGKSIYERIQEKLQPQNEYEDKINVFDIFKGCTLKLKGSPNDGGWMNYAKSEWMSPAPIKENRDELKALWEEYIKSKLDLSEFLDPSKIKSYDEIYDMFCKYQNFGRSVEQRIPNNKSRDIGKDQDEFFGYDEDDVKEIKTDKPMKLEDELDDSIPDFSEIGTIPDTTPAQPTSTDDVDDFIAQLNL